MSVKNISLRVTGVIGERYPIEGSASIWIFIVASLNLEEKAVHFFDILRDFIKMCVGLVRGKIFKPKCHYITTYVTPANNRLIKNE